MKCRDFIDLLEELLEEHLPEDARRAALEHAQGCESCSELLVTATDPSFDLADAVLERTSGSPCDSARKLLCDNLDGDLERVDSELVRLHLAGCEECAALSRTVAALSRDLPVLAEMKPDSRFLEEVLARTLPVESPAGRWAVRVIQGWQALMRRPRIALEGAYIGTAVLVLAFGAQSALLAEIPRRALELASVNPVSEISRPAARLQTNISWKARSVWRVTGSRAIDACEEMGAEVVRMSIEAGARIRADVGTLVDDAASRLEKGENEVREKDDER
jgi:predicted anti-sigma-YlaC factor YlaD